MNRYNNPFPFSDDNKRYHTWNYYLKHKFGNKTAKVPLDAGFSCPNRDGTKGFGGCTYCSAKGSGDSIVARGNLMEQYEQGLSVMQRKWPDCQGIAYFQAFTNTYGPMEKLKQCFSPFIQREDVCAIAIATRADCLEDEKIAYLCELAKEKEVWVELGLQTIHDQTAALINRGHDFSEFRSCVERLASTPLHVCVHLINSLPMETKSQMIESTRIVGSLPIEAVKIHMLHLVKGTQLAKQYEENPFPDVSACNLRHHAPRTNRDHSSFRE